MPTVLPNMGLTLPTRGSAGAGVWDDTIDANLHLEDEHDHSSGKGLRITPAAMNINADLPFSSLYAPTQLHRLSFSAIAAGALTGSHNKSLFVSDGTSGLSANELYWRTSAGNNVKLTSGNSLNVSAFVGGIGGDYQSVTAQLDFDDSQKRYTFKEGTSDSHGWARLAAGGLRLIEFNTTESVYVGQNCPAGLASTYDMTWPTALPGAAGALVQLDNTGQISFANTGVNGVTLASNTSVTISGTGEYKHGNMTLTIAPGGGYNPTGTFTPDAAGAVSCSATGNWFVPIPLRTGDRVQSFTIAGFGDGSVDVVFEIFYVSKLGVSTTKATANITNAPASWNDSTATAGSPTALAAGEVCVAKVNPNATGFAFNNFRIVYDRP